MKSVSMPLILIHNVIRLTSPVIITGLNRAVASLSLPGGQDKMISSIFPQFPVASLIFSSIFLLFLPHFGLPGGRLTHPGIHIN